MKKVNFKDIIIPIYYNIIENEIIIDEDSIRDEFEIRLKKAYLQRLIIKGR